MHEMALISFMIIGILAIDYAIRVSIKRSRDSKRFKSCGILALLTLCLTEKPQKTTEKIQIIKQLLLSMPIVLFLLGANYFLIREGMPNDINMLQFSLLLAPLLFMPFYHFLYELFLIQPLSIDGILATFHQRGVNALILGANLIFVSMEPLQNLASLSGHFFLVFLALLGSFYLCTSHRKVTSQFDFSFKDFVDYLKPSTFRYLAGILELQYTLILVYLFFLQVPLALLFAGFEGLLPAAISTGLLLVVIATIVKYRFYQNAPATPQFYEERLLPLSFLWFGVITIFRTYF